MNQYETTLSRTSEVSNADSDASWFSIAIFCTVIICFIFALVYIRVVSPEKIPLNPSFTDRAVRAVEEIV